MSYSELYRSVPDPLFTGYSQLSFSSIILTYVRFYQALAYVLILQQDTRNSGNYKLKFNYTNKLICICHSAIY